jgi:hypothetical protein
MKDEGPRLRHYPDVTLQLALRLRALHPSRLLRTIPLEVVRVFGSGDGTGDDPVGRNRLAAWRETQDRGSRAAGQTVLTRSRDDLVIVFVLGCLEVKGPSVSERSVAGRTQY